MRQTSSQNSMNDDGLLWFKVAEAIFNFRGLSDDKRKCELLLSALDHRHLSILEFSLAHLGEHPYDDLKSALLRHYAPTKEEKLHQLLYLTTLSFIGVARIFDWGGPKPVADQENFGDGGF